MKGINMQANKKRWLTPKELEEEYCFSKSVQAKMRMLSSKKKIPFSKVGSKFIRYDRFEIDKWLEIHKVITSNHKE
jgi:predicted DNA-binding transcriptional regulator AlpA